MLVKAMMPTAYRRLTTINADASLTDAAKLLSDTQISLVVVCDAQGSMVGVITETDIIRQIAQGQGCPTEVLVSAIMTKDVVHCLEGDLLHEVWTNMKARGFIHIPVIDRNSRPSGVINARDALQALLGEVRDQESLLRDYIMGMGYR
jgi:CBS domain-containing protein